MRSPYTTASPATTRSPWGRNCATQAGPRSLHEVQLVADTGGKRFPSVAARLDGDIQRYTFRGLPPGVYRAEVQGARVVGNAIEVLAGSEQEVDVTIVP